MESSPLSDRAHAALALANHEPGRAVPAAAAVVAEAARLRSPVDAAIGELAWGHALLATGDAANALVHLRRAMSLAARSGREDLRGEAAIKLAFAELQQGHGQRSLRILDAVLPGLQGGLRGRALAQRAVNLHLLGELDGSAAGFREALPEVRAAGEPIAVQRLLTNYGILLTDRHEFAAADAVLTEAEEIARSLERTYSVGVILENRSYAAGLRGDIPRALALLDTAAEIVESLDGNVALLHQDRAELLLGAGLATEARTWADRAVAENVAMHRYLKASEVRLVAAQAALAAGDADAAVREAVAAIRDFARQRRPAWVAQGRLVVLRARLAGAAASLTTAQIIHTVETLAAAGRPSDAMEAWVCGARMITGRRSAQRRREWLALAAGYATRTVPATVRARGWYARALLRDDAGDAAAARSALRAGLRVLDQHSTTLAASDLRVRSAAARADLSRTGVRWAVADGRPAGVLEWVERAKASRLTRAVRPPDDPVLTSLLADLRALSARAESGATPVEPARIAAAEAAVRDRYRRHPPVTGERLRSDRSSSRPPRAADLRAPLGRQRLLDFFDLDGTLRVVVVDRQRCQVLPVAPTQLVTDLVDRLTFALRQLSGGGLAERSAAAIDELLTRTARGLDALLAPALSRWSGEELVVCPTGPLHDLPWSLLPSFADLSISVTPSATIWHQGAPAGRRSPGRPVVVAGPGLPGALSEATEIAAIHRVAAVVDGASTAERLLAALPYTDLLHLSAHGRLSAENPLFSAILLADGPLMVYDLERAPRVPDTVVLASCDTARNQVCTGDELLGLAATLLSQGCTRLIAPVVPVPDLATRAVMVALHGLLAQGADPAVALAGVQTALRGDEQLGNVAAAFVCLAVHRAG